MHGSSYQFAIKTLNSAHQLFRSDEAERHVAYSHYVERNEAKSGGKDDARIKPF